MVKFVSACQGALTAFIVLGLSACSTGPAVIPAPVPVYEHVCPAAPKYTKAFEKAAGVQLQGLPAGSPDAQMISDYLAVRAEIVACSK